MAGAIVSDHGLGEAIMTIGGVALVTNAHVVSLRRAICC